MSIWWCTIAFLLSLQPFEASLHVLVPEFGKMVDVCVLQSLDSYFGGLLVTTKREDRVMGAVAAPPSLAKDKQCERKKHSPKSKRNMPDRLLAPKPAIAKAEPTHRRRLRAPLSLVIPNCITDDSVVDYNVRKPHSAPQRRCVSLDLDRLMEVSGLPLPRQQW